jgi:hypothetical protein
MWRSYGKLYAHGSVSRGDFKKLVKTAQKLNMNYPTMMPGEYEVVPMPKARGWSRKGASRFFSRNVNQEVRATRRIRKTP